MNDRYYRWMMLPVCVLLAGCIYIPLARGIIMAFQNYNMYDLSSVSFNGLDNFYRVITDSRLSFAQILLNTLVWLLFSLLFQFVLGFGLALLLRNPFVGRSFFSGLVFYAWALSGFAIGLVWAWLFNGQFGLFNDLLMRMGLLKGPIGFLSSPRLAMFSVIAANVWYGVPFFAIMLLAALQSIPKELYEAAVLDGAGSVRQLVYVTIPAIRPTIISSVLLRTMWIVNFPDIIYAMTNGGPVNSTNILATHMIQKVFKEYDYGEGSAVGVIIMLFLFLYAALYLKISRSGEGDL